MKEICQVQPNETKDFGKDVRREAIEKYVDIDIDIHIAMYTCQRHIEICGEGV